MTLYDISVFPLPVFCLTGVGKVAGNSCRRDGGGIIKKGKTMGIGENDTQKKNKGMWEGALRVIGPLNDRVVLPRMLSVAQTGWYIGLSEKTIRNKLSNRTFPVRPKKFGGKILFDIIDLDNYLDKLEGV